MYFWKCWRDTRTAFVVMAGAVLFAAALGFFLIFDVGGWRTSRDAPGMWLSTGHLLVSLPIFVVPLAGFFLGVGGVGEELGRGSSVFLITRPRSRRYFLWAGWFVGSCEIVAIMLLAVLMRSLRLLAPSHAAVYPGPRSNILQPGDFIKMTALALVIYSLTYFFTTVLRSGRLGSNLALATVLIYCTVTAWLAPGHVITGALPWVALAVFLVYAAQVLFERAEA